MRSLMRTAYLCYLDKVLRTEYKTKMNADRTAVEWIRKNIKQKFSLIRKDLLLWFT